MRQTHVIGVCAETVNDQSLPKMAVKAERLVSLPLSHCHPRLLSPGPKRGRAQLLCFPGPWSQEESEWPGSLAAGAWMESMWTESLPAGWCDQPRSQKNSILVSLDVEFFLKSLPIKNVRVVFVPVQDETVLKSTI